MTKPKRPTGNTPMHRFLQWVFDSILASRINEVVGGKINRTPTGITIIVDQQPNQKAPPTWI